MIIETKYEIGDVVWFKYPNPWDTSFTHPEWGEIEFMKAIGREMSVTEKHYTEHGEAWVRGDAIWRVIVTLARPWWNRMSEDQLYPTYEACLKDIKEPK